MNLTKTPYLILFIVLGAAGISAAYAVGTITLAGNVAIEGDTKMEGNLKLDGAHGGIFWNSRIPQSNILTTIDTGTFSGIGTSITIGTDGLPIISYLDDNNGNVYVAKCGNPLCVPNWIRR